MVLIKFSFLSLNLVLSRKNVFTSTIQCEIRPEILGEFWELKKKTTKRFLESKNFFNFWCFAAINIAVFVQIICSYKYNEGLANYCVPCKQLLFVMTN